MSLFVIPKRVVYRLEKIQRDFLWGGGTLVNKPHLVNWPVVCLDNKKGGLGFRSLLILNKALREMVLEICEGNESSLETGDS